MSYPDPELHYEFQQDRSDDEVSDPTTDTRPTDKEVDYLLRFMPNRRDLAMAFLIKEAELRQVEERNADLERGLRQIISGDWQRYPTREGHGQTTVRDFAAYLLAAGMKEPREA